MHVVLEKGAISYDDLFMHLGYRFRSGVDYVDLESGLAATSLLMKSSKSGPIFQNKYCGIYKIHEAVISSRVPTYVLKFSLKSQVLDRGTYRQASEGITSPILLLMR